MVNIIGSIKKIDIASAIGSVLSATENNQVAIARQKPRAASVAEKDVSLIFCPIA